MKKIHKHIEIVSASAPGLSSMGGESRNAVRAVLAKYYTNVGITIVNTVSDLEALAARKPDLVFLGMKFVPVHPHLGSYDPDRIWVGDYLDEHGIIYTGSGSVAHGLELNKPLAKQRVLDSGLKTAPFYVTQQQQVLIERDITLKYPVFIKPSNRGGGLGIDSRSVAHNFQEVASKVQTLATELQSDSLIERYLPGREFSVAILKDEYASEFSVMPIELIAPQDERGVRMLSGRVKSSNSEDALEVMDPTIKAEVCGLAMDVFSVLGARDYGRIDIRLDELGVPHFLEANLLPSLISGYGSFPKACVMNMGLDHESMVLNIVSLALRRSASNDVQILLPTHIVMGPSFEPALQV